MTQEFNMPSRTRRRWFQFSLKQVFALVSFCCIGLVVWEEWMKPSLTVEPIMRNETAVVRGSCFLDFKAQPMAGAVHARRREPNGDWVIYQANTLTLEPQGFGRYSFECKLPAPGGAWTPGVYEVQVIEALHGKVPAQGALVVRDEGLEKRQSP